MRSCGGMLAKPRCQSRCFFTLLFSVVRMYSVEWAFRTISGVGGSVVMIHNLF